MMRYNSFDDLSGFEEVADTGVRILGFLDLLVNHCKIFSKVQSLDRLRGFIYVEDPRIALLVNDRAIVDPSLWEMPDSGSIDWPEHTRAVWLYSSTETMMKHSQDQRIFTVYDNKSHTFRADSGFLPPYQGLFFRIFHHGSMNYSQLLQAHIENAREILQTEKVSEGVNLVERAMVSYEFLRQISPVSMVA